ncbi:MAG: alpha/beta hydrolase [Phenylobacterium sp.]|uniref:alpha/beta fold hydrolase n=1 Tax=Phenylobacterium sp. TaxID=1871053 RepID=UPI00273710B9|nr:alpha/beta hydrolase [Phenylobacterium sp.]MDP3748562.1 alpha/beta hydrolase [Phenylobacterium sp.]
MKPTPQGSSRRLMLAGGASMAAGLAMSDKGFAMETKTKAGGHAEVDGLSVYYELHGGSPTSGKTPMVLLPGGVMAIDTAFTADIIPRFSKTWPIIAIEPQGHGHTGDREGPFRLERMSDDVAGVLKHLGVKQAHLFGHSLGGMIATGVAIRHPALVASLTAVGTTFNLDGMLPELAKLQRGEIKEPSAELVPLLPTEADFAAWQANYNKHNPKPETFFPVLEKLNAMLGSWEGWTPAQLGAIRAKTLLAIGDNDFTRIEHAAEMKRLIPGAQLAVLPGTTHMGIIERGAWLEPLIAARIAAA